MAIGMDVSRRRATALRSAWFFAAGLGLAAAAPAVAKRADANQPPPPAVENLNTALDDLTKAPNDADALLRAGWASLNLGDTQAALGFFRRAEQAAPASGEARAGEASALLRLDRPVDAVKLFAAAEAAGAPMARYAGERGLALDLVGENVAAQQNYRLALTQKYDPEVVRRLALSQAISGDQRAAEATLLPLLQQRDLSAYRTRAFALAILGHGEEAVSVADKLLPADLSSRMAPYLRYMPRLTRAQQAAAANLGKFPPASEIGRDDPQIAALSAENPAPQVGERGPGSRLVPTGEPLGKKDRNDKRRHRRETSHSTGGADRNAAALSPSADLRPAAQPPAVRAAAAPLRETPIVRAATPPQVRQASAPSPPPQLQVEQSEAKQTPAPQPTAAPVVVAKLEPGAAAAAPAVADREAPRPSLSISPSTAAAPAKPVTLADAFSGFAKNPPPGRADAGAVDITKIKPARGTPKPVAKPKPPANPSRYWVQVGTGRNLKALAFTWRRLQKRGGALLAKHEAYSAKWGATRRLVTGPYKSEDEAQDTVKALKKKGIDSFEFTSEQGEQVAPLK